MVDLVPIASIGSAPIADQHQACAGDECISPIVRRLQLSMLDRGVPRESVRTVIASLCGISYQSVFHWFNGRTQFPRADYLALVAQHYDIDLGWLILGERT